MIEKLKTEMIMLFEEQHRNYTKLADAQLKDIQLQKELIDKLLTKITYLESIAIDPKAFDGNLEGEEE